VLAAGSAANEMRLKWKSVRKIGPKGEMLSAFARLTEILKYALKSVEKKQNMLNIDTNIKGKFKGLLGL
jgi:hypothetical protein